MKKIVLLVVSLLITFTSFAEESVELPPLDPGYEGVHGMVLVSKSSTIYAANLVQYKKPHDVQLLYKLESKDLALLQTVRDGQLVTIKPQPFNIQRLVRGEKLVVNADIYSGHYKRGGMLVYKDMPLTFAKQLYVRSLEDIKDSSRLQEYDVVNLRKNYRIYVHRLQKAPSFTQLMHVDLEAGCMSRFSTSSAVPKETELQYKFLNCGTMKPLYFETEDFQAKRKGL